jgi:hypothetical protein
MSTRGELLVLETAGSSAAARNQHVRCVYDRQAARWRLRTRQQAGGGRGCCRTQMMIQGALQSLTSFPAALLVTT